MADRPGRRTRAGAEGRAIVPDAPALVPDLVTDADGRPVSADGPRGPAPATVLAPRAVVPIEAVWDAYFYGRHRPTAARYRASFRDYVAFAYHREDPEVGRRVRRPEGAVRAGMAQLLAEGPNAAFTLVNMYMAASETNGDSSATIAGRVSALRSFVRFARNAGSVDWVLDVKAPHVQRYRDTRGPGLVGWKGVLEALAAARRKAGTARVRALRDTAILRLLHDRGLRRAEAVALTLADLDLDSDPPQVNVIGKGKKNEKDWLSINKLTRNAIEAWLAARGPFPARGGAAPVFVGIARDGVPLSTPLSGTSVYEIVVRYGLAAGLERRVRPHGLRHQGITRALDLAGGDVRKVQHFSRHAQLDTLMIYDDNRRDEAAIITEQLGADSPG